MRVLQVGEHYYILKPFARATDGDGPQTVTIALYFSLVLLMLQPRGLKVGGGGGGSGGGVAAAAAAAAAAAVKLLLLMVLLSFLLAVLLIAMASPDTHVAHTCMSCDDHVCTRHLCPPLRNFVRNMLCLLYTSPSPRD